MTDTPNQVSRLQRIRRILTGAYFVQRALLLVLAALLSGLVVPLIFKSIDQSREQQQFIRRAQAKLFDDVSETLFTLQTLAMDVSWYGTAEAKNAELQRKAFAKYSDRVGELTSKLVLLDARAKTLTSAPISSKLKAMMDDIYKSQDTPINKLWTECETKCNWQPQHDDNQRVSKHALELVGELARDLGLVKSAD